jgi:hypothetical protein
MEDSVMERTAVDGHGGHIPRGARPRAAVLQHTHNCGSGQARCAAGDEAANLGDGVQRIIAEWLAQGRGQGCPRLLCARRCVIRHGAQQRRGETIVRLQARPLGVCEQAGAARRLCIDLQQCQPRDAAQVHARNQLLECLLPRAGALRVQRLVRGQAGQGGR